MVITLTGYGTVDANGIAQLNLAPPIIVTITPTLVALPINSVEGFNLVNAIVATFTAPIIPALPTGTGLPASDFTASIDWGDPSPDLAAGTITQDASNPSVYYVTGTHTFAENGSYTVATTVFLTRRHRHHALLVVNGSTGEVTITWPASGPTPPTATATATVTQGPLAVSAFPIVGTEGTAIAAGPIATFIDAGGAAPVADYSATITVTNSAGTVVVGPGDQHHPERQRCAVHRQRRGLHAARGGHVPGVGRGHRHCRLNPDHGLGRLDGRHRRCPADRRHDHDHACDGEHRRAVPRSSAPSPTPIPLRRSSDFTATIDWGDGSPNSIGTITQPGGVGTPFDVTGGHTYAKPGTGYTVTMIVKDVGGSMVTITGSVPVTDLPVTGADQELHRRRGPEHRHVRAGDVHRPQHAGDRRRRERDLAVGGWGDGTPTAAGVTLTVQEIGVTPLTSATNPGDPIFEVLGSHTYAEESPQARPRVSVIITTLGGATTTLTALRRRRHRHSTPRSPVPTARRSRESRGRPYAGTVPCSAPSPTPTRSRPSPTSQPAPGSVVVNWGDGSAPETLAAGDLTAIGTPNGVA